MSTDDNKYIISDVKAAWECRCPRCKTGKMFVGGLFRIKGESMLKRCPHCDFKFEMEPGFFYVAMFVSYALSVAEFITVCVATYVLSGGSESPWLYLAACVLITIICSGFNFRYSRVIQMYWLVPNLKFNERFYGEKYKKLES